MMYVGTDHFVDRKAALKYYRELGGYKEVNSKLKEGLITIGRPNCKKGERLTVNDEGRYVKIINEQKK